MTRVSLMLILMSAPLTITSSGWMPSFMSGLKHTNQTSKSFTLPKQGTLALQQARGTITIETWNKPTAMIHITTHARTPEELKAITLIHEINGTELALTLKQPDTASTIETKLIVPHGAAVEVNITELGNFMVKQSPRKLSATTKKGAISINSKQDSTIRAQSDHGNIEVTCNIFPATSSLMLTARYGGVTLTIPMNTNAHINASSKRGPIISKEIPVTLDPYTITLTKESWKQIAKSIQGTLGDGGGRITIDAFGRVVINALP